MRTVEHILLIILLVTAISLNSQAPNLDWTEQFCIEDVTIFNTLEILTNGDLVLGGSIYRSEIGQSDALIVKTDNIGNMVWRYIYHGLNDCRVTDLLETAENSTWVVVKNNFSSDELEFFTSLLLIDESGNLINEIDYNNCTGNSRITNLTDGNYLIDSFDGSNSRLIKIDPTGLIIWEKEDSDYEDFEFNFTRGKLTLINDSDDFLIAGPNLPFQGYHFAMARFNNAGELIWNYSRNLVTFDYSPPLIINDLIYVIEIYPTWISLLKFSLEGELQDAELIFDDVDWVDYDKTILNDEQYFVLLGRTNDNEINHLQMTCINLNGDILFSNSYNIMGTDYLYDMMYYDDNTIFAVGRTDETDDSIFNPNGILTKFSFDPIGDEPDEINPISTTLSNYPNPFNPTTTISFSLNTEITENTEIEIFNVKGQKIKSFLIPPSPLSPITSVIWNGTDNQNNLVSSGVYLYSLKQGDKTLASKKMLLIK